MLTLKYIHNFEQIWTN